MKTSAIKIITIAIFMASLFVIHSCIELKNQVGNRVIKDENFQTEEDFNVALIPAYSLLRRILWDWFNACGVSSDEMILPTRGPDWDDGGVWRRYQRHEWTPDESNLDPVWMNNYAGIARANRVLAEIEASPASFNTKAAVTAELRCLRAWYYFLLMDFFGGVPIIETDDFDPNDPPARNTRTEVFNFIEADLLAAIPNLPIDYDYGRFSKGAAQTLLAKLYLNSVVFTGAPRWQDCADLCSAITNSGQYSLTADYFDNFQPDNHTTGELEIILPAIVDPQVRVVKRNFSLPMNELFHGLLDPFDAFRRL